MPHSSRMSFMQVNRLMQDWPQPNAAAKRTCAKVSFSQIHWNTSMTTEVRDYMKMR
ncbi:unnamed protein product [Soboliphyme baturini]|uniref:Uncharacterized protein n=1 Tax=Soboliphyme baturini TaxID=241478 RepID=A0A183ITK0_9BILA|nr:unnamed protein product [Soboliphyme baturini]